MRIKKYRTFACDFETTVYEGQTDTAVWLGGFVELFTEDAKVFGSIQDTFNAILELDSNVILYYHNLKFDGSFWLDYLLRELKYEQAYTQSGNDTQSIRFLKDRDMPNKSFKYSISDRGQWYTLTIKQNDRIIEFRDSLKLLPFSLKKIGKDFKTKHQKLSMKYEGFRYPNCPVSDSELEYFKSDLFVLKEGLEIMYQEGHNALTIGSCCLNEFKNIIGDEYEVLFPNLSEYPLDEYLYGAKTADEYVRKSYGGGWCYVKEDIQGKKITPVVKNKNATIRQPVAGLTADVNSLYPSVMHSESGNAYPTGLPTFWRGNYISENALKKNRYYFIRIKTRFYLKEGYLPFIHIRNNYLYRGNENLKTSDYYDEETNQYYTHYRTSDGKIHDTRIELTLTCTDFERLKEHYNLVDFEILDGCYFFSVVGIFDEYINKYRSIKEKAVGAIRTLAKLFLNNLYGKLAASDYSSFKVAHLDEDGKIRFYTVDAQEKEIGYIPCGSAITSYARDFTIRAAQKNYDRFCYADTDSLHCIGGDDLNGVPIHPTAFCHWKIESKWNAAIFTRQKTYIEHIIENEDGATDYYNVICAGMPERCKHLFIASITGEYKYEDELTKAGKKFIKTKRTLNDFRVGLRVPDKLMPQRITGGIVLKETTYEMR